MLQKIFLFSLFFLLFGTRVFANEDINISVNTENISVGDMFLLEISFDPGLSQGAIQLDIPGIEAFSVFSQSQKQQVQSINGVTESIFQYQLQIQALEDGEFELGPVMIQMGTEEIIDDEIVKIIVDNDGNIPDEVIEDGQDLQTETQEHPEIKGLRNYEVPNLLKIIFGIIFFSIFYLFLKKYFFPEGVKAVSEIPKHILERRRKIELFIQSLEYNYETLSDKDFRIKILSGLRQIFISEGIQNIHKQTLSELELNKNFSQHGLENIYREIYFAEYAEKNIERDTRKKYLESIKKYVTELGK